MIRKDRAPLSADRQLLRRLIKVRHIEEGLELLSTEGLRRRATLDETVIFEGHLFGQPNTLITLFADNYGRIEQMMIVVPTDNTWQAIKEQYLSLRRLLHRTTLLRIASMTTFAPPYREGDGREIEAIGKDLCYYSALFRYCHSLVGLFVGHEKGKAKLLITIKHTQWR